MGEPVDAGRLLGHIAQPTRTRASYEDTANASGGGFSFDEDTLRDLVTDWLTLADEYRESVVRTDQLILIQPPGLDFASEAQTKAVHRHTEAFLRYLAHNHDYCLRQAQNFQDALHDYLGIERRNVRDLQDAGDPERSGPLPGI
ncbi:hypothetical protein [Actinophytocola xinjiangensis]|uniref:hypothetical protein n=1 Tax=Actinophytocola xinjiangensis TaxID=485602 RepID=UPI000B0BE422|nr:hypothetical protein [Actinophytocola xinjiangensis]